MLQFKAPTNRKKQKDSIKDLFMQKEGIGFHGQKTEHFQGLISLSGHIITLDRCASALPGTEYVLWEI